jgi:exosortase E/protease (VPEID-CTERM system)
VAVVAEYLILSVSFDAQLWLRHVQLEAQLGAIKLVGPAVLAAIAGVFALGGSRFLTSLSTLAHAQPNKAAQRALLVAHIVSFGALYALSSHIFVAPFTAVTHPLLWFGGWALLGTITIGFLVAAFIDIASIGQLFSQHLKLVVVATVLTVIAFQAGGLSSTFWKHTSGPVLTVLGAATKALFEGGYVDTETRVLGTSRFAIEIAPACSGYEGIGLILVFLSGFLFMSRAHLRFPSALVVLPIGVVLVYTVNLVRIVALLGFGHHVSPTIAVAGFHAYAGWILFCAVALTLVYWTDRRFARERVADDARSLDTATTAYLGPQLALIATSLVTGLFATDIDLLYFARSLAAIGVLYVFRAHFAGMLALPSLLSIVIGVVIAGLWLYVVQPPEGGVSPLAAELDTLTPASRVLWLASRLFGFIVMAPVVEELAFRGYIMRRVQAADFTAVPLERWSVPGIAVSSLLFGWLHGSFVAGTAAGLLLALAAIQRGKLIDAIAAHAVANLVLGVIGLARGAYWLW